MASRPPCPISRIEVTAYRIPCDSPRSDGTFEWTDTTLVLVEASAADQTGLGYTYADRSTGVLIHDLLANIGLARDALDIRSIWDAMCASVRNLGRAGIAAMAISAVDCALWDLKSKLLSVPLFHLVGAVRDSIPLYGSGGFTSQSVDQLREQFAHWSSAGITRFKMKVGRDASADIHRVSAARAAIGETHQLFVDANGAYSRKQALSQAHRFGHSSVTWFEEPVSSDDINGLRLIRDQSPPGMDIAAGEYAYESDSFLRLLSAGCVDVLQADATRCRGFTGLLQASVLCDAFHIPMSTHCAPALHAHPGCAITRMQHLEYFADHERIEQMLFDGVLLPQNGSLYPDPERPGHGLEFKHADAAPYRCL